MTRHWIEQSWSHLAHTSLSNEQMQSKVSLDLLFYAFNAQAYHCDLLNYKGIAELCWTVSIMEPLMVSFQVPSIAVCPETKAHSKIHFQVTGIPRLPTRSIRMLQWTWLGLCCWRNLPREKWVWRCCHSNLLFFPLRQRGRNGACVLLSLSQWSTCSHRWSWLRIFCSYFPKPHKLDRLWFFPSDKFPMNMAQLPMIDLPLEFVWSLFLFLF